MLEACCGAGVDPQCAVCYHPAVLLFRRSRPKPPGLPIDCGASVRLLSDVGRAAFASHPELIHLIVPCATKHDLETITAGTIPMSIPLSSGSALDHQFSLSRALFCSFTASELAHGDN